MFEIEIKNVNKRFKNIVLYENLSLNVASGRTIGIVGGNGTGKSVLFKMIAGLEDADAGEIYVRQKQVGHNYDFPESLGCFVNQPGYIEFYDGFTNLKMLADIQKKIGSAEVRAFMKKVGLDPNNKTPVKKYSTGMRQKLGIAQAIMEGQEIVLLDEPFNALDFQTNTELMSLLLDLKKEGKTLLLTSHQHEYLETLCDEIYIIIDKKLAILDDKMKAMYFTFFPKENA